MKPSIAGLVIIGCITVLSLAGAGTVRDVGAQGRGSAERIGSMTPAIFAPDEEQRKVLNECLVDGKRAHKIADLMVGPGTRWRYDATIFSEQSRQLRIALTEIERCHHRFRETLTPTQKAAFAIKLEKLREVSGDLEMRMDAIDRELAKRKADPRRLYSDAHKIKELTGKWHAVHRKFAQNLDKKDGKQVSASSAA